MDLRRPDEPRVALPRPELPRVDLPRVDLPAPARASATATRQPPISRALESALRSEGLKVKAERARGHVALKVWAGIPGTETALVAPPPADSPTWLPPITAPGPLAMFAPGPNEVLDVHDRFEVAMALAGSVLPLTPRPWMWLTRSGTPDPCPEDMVWLSAAQHAWQVLGLRLDAAIVTREGWWLHPSGTRRTWQRLRA